MENTFFEVFVANKTFPNTRGFKALGGQPGGVMGNGIAGTANAHHNGGLGQGRGYQ